MTGPDAVEAFLDGITDPGRRGDARALAAMMAEVTGERPYLGYDKIVGFGRYHYRYPSGREGDAAILGFSPTSRGLTIYVASGFVGYEDLLAGLGKHRTTKVCLYVRRLDDLDLGVLRRLLERSADHIEQTVRALGAVPRLSEMPPYDPRQRSSATTSPRPDR